MDIRDRRQAHWFWMHDTIVDRGPQLGAYGIAVYAALARHAERDEQTQTSLSRLAKTLGLSRPTIVKTLNVLIEHGLITREKTVTVNGDSRTNRYILLQLQENQGHVRCGSKGDLLGSKGDLLSFTSLLDLERSKTREEEGVEACSTDEHAPQLALSTPPESAPALLPSPRQGARARQHKPPRASQWLSRAAWEGTDEGWFYDLLTTQDDLWQQPAFVLNLDWWHALDVVYALDGPWLLAQFNRMRVKFASGYPRPTSAAGWKRFLTAWIDREFANQARETKRARSTNAQQNPQRH